VVPTVVSFARRFTTTRKLIDTTTHLQERALLVELERPGRDHWQASDSLAELAELARSAGAVIVDRATQKLAEPTPAHFIGRGKAEELAAKYVTGLPEAERVTSVIFDDDLTPAQAGNLQKIFGCKVLDRTELILDIFAQRARTREGKLQIELAQLQYMLPRLTRLWTHLSRQYGGIGTRGPGETQLEVDRRRIEDRIRRLRAEIAEVRKHRAVMRSGRRRHEWPIVAIIGYTNAGKSTLLNALTDARVVAEDKLFATLDPTTRRLRLANNRNVLLTDTVGFLRRLPHHLVDSFYATLEEVVEADVLIHVVDASHPQVFDQIAAVNQVLQELKTGQKSTVTALNKTDRVETPTLLDRLTRETPNAIAISALKKTGFDALLSELSVQLTPRHEFVRLVIPTNQTALVARLHRDGQVLQKKFVDGRCEMDVKVPPSLLAELQAYRRDDGAI
jgi:GTP-binding protein HflX